MSQTTVTSVAARFVFLTTAVIVVLVTPSAYATSVPANYTNQNFWTSTHDIPVSFTRDRDGTFFGETATGKSFTQMNVATNSSVRLQKFTIDEAYFYISDRGIIFAPTNTIALSIYLDRPASV